MLGDMRVLCLPAMIFLCSCGSEHRAPDPMPTMNSIRHDGDAQSLPRLITGFESSQTNLDFFYLAGFHDAMREHFEPSPQRNTFTLYQANELAERYYRGWGVASKLLVEKNGRPRTRAPLSVEGLTIGVYGMGIDVNGAFVPSKSTPIITSSNATNELLGKSIGQIVGLLGPGEIFERVEGVVSVVWAVEDGGLLMVDGPFTAGDGRPSSMMRLDSGRQSLWGQ
jgi:hypothetical protein